MGELKIKLPVGGHQNTGGSNPPELTDFKIGDVSYKLNEKGEAVDDKGTIIKTKEEIELLKNPVQKTAAELEAERVLIEKNKKIDTLLVEGTEVELDGTKYKLTKEGTILGTDGKVLKTKEEVRALVELEDEQSSDTDYITEIQKATNLIITGENNEPVKYENTIPGLTQYAQDVYTEGTKIGAEEFKNKLFSQFPILPTILEHLALKGSLKDFIEEVDYSKVVVGEDDVQHHDLYLQAQRKRGIPDTEIENMFKYLKDDKKSKEAATSSLLYLQSSQTQSATARANAVKAQQDAQDVEDLAYANEINKALVSKELVVGDKKFKLPEIIKIKDKEGKIVTKSLTDFRNYIDKPINFNIEGKIYTMTQLQYDEAMEDTQRTPHHDLFDAFRRFTKNDDSQLIAANISSGVVKQVIKLKTKAGGGGSEHATGDSRKLKLPIK